MLSKSVENLQYLVPGTWYYERFNFLVFSSKKLIGHKALKCRGWQTNVWDAWGVRE